MNELGLFTADSREAPLTRGPERIVCLMKEAAALEADTMISREEEKKNGSTKPTLAHLGPTKRWRLGGTRVWCRYLPRLSAVGRKMKGREKDSESGSGAAGEKTPSLLISL